MLTDDSATPSPGPTRPFPIDQKKDKISAKKAQFTDTK